MVTLVACCVTKCQEVPIRLAQIWHSLFLLWISLGKNQKIRLMYKTDGGYILIFG
jgi:hypothetical protein